MNAQLRKLRREISDAKATLNRPQSYSAQVIGCALKEIAATFGRDEANKASTELGLLKCGWKLEQESMNPTTKLQNARHVVIALASAPEPSSEIMLADNKQFYLSAARSRFKGGLVLKLVRKADQQRFSIAGYKKNEVKASVTVTDMIAIATRYIESFMTSNKAPMITVPPATPITAKDRICNVIAKLDGAIKRMTDERIHNVPLWSELNAARSEAKAALVAVL